MKDSKLEEAKAKIEEDLKEQTRDLQELQMSLIANKQIMKDILEKEKERVLTKVLPQRYSLNNIEVHPLAIEYIVKG